MWGFFPLALAAACAQVEETRHNVLLVILDDLGVDRVACYGEHPSPPRTPTLDALARRGVLFRSAWANPLCSPTRATIFTGRYSFRTGIGRAIRRRDGERGLALEEVTLPEVLRAGSEGRITSALFGKWHLTSPSLGPRHPLDSGFDVHSGSLYNLLAPDGTSSYFRWEKTVDGETTLCERYATTETVDDALRAIAGEVREPWFVVVSFNAVHTPLHAPPPGLRSRELPPRPRDDPPSYHEAMCEALDSELGRLFSTIEVDLLARTNVVVVGDNGTEARWVESSRDLERGKGTLYDGGVRVPLIVAGPAVRGPGRECTALVNTTDVFATVAELCGVDAHGFPEGAGRDSISFAPHLRDPTAPSLRVFSYAESFSPNRIGNPADGGPADNADPRRGQRYARRSEAIRDARHKIIREQGAPDQFYDLVADPREQHDLLAGGLDAAQQEGYDRLAARLREFAR